MEDNAITVLPVVDDALKPFGALHLHDLVRAGLSVRSNRGEPAADKPL
jgi:CBS domain-containing protein